MNRLITLTLAGVVLISTILIATLPPLAAQGDATPRPTLSYFSDTATLTPDIRLVEQVRRGEIAAIDDPVFLTADEADASYAPGELVIGLDIDGDARAYSVPLLSRHEIVNDVVGGVPVAVTWCPLCFTAIVYERSVDGRVLDFGVSGLLRNNNLVMVDRQTDSLWPQSNPTAIQGPLAGATLQFRTSMLLTWEAWRTLHPNSLTLQKPAGVIDGYSSYYNNDEIGVSNVPDFDVRLPGKAFILGVQNGDDAVAYPFSRIVRESVINDHVGAVPLVIIYLPDGDTALSYDRTLADGTVLDFAPGDTPSTMIDLQTGSIWDAWRGEAISGPLAGELLFREQSLRVFWFHWRDLYPDSRIFGQSQ